MKSPVHSTNTNERGCGILTRIKTRVEFELLIFTIIVFVFFFTLYPEFTPSTVDQCHAETFLVAGACREKMARQTRKSV